MNSSAAVVRENYSIDLDIDAANDRLAALNVGSNEQSPNSTILLEDDIKAMRTIGQKSFFKTNYEEIMNKPKEEQRSKPIRRDSTTIH